MLVIINQVVDENWDELLNCAKDLIDAKLEDGETYFNKLSWFGRCLAINFNLICLKSLINSDLYPQSAKGSFDFSERTEDCEKSTFDAVKTILSKLPPVDGNLKDFDDALIIEILC